MSSVCNTQSILPWLVWTSASTFESIKGSAHKAGRDNGDIKLSISAPTGAYKLTLTDRGSGMSDKVLQSALLPFYSTKQTGTGLGLPLCREIVEAHGGKMALNNRQGGGLQVSLWLPRV